MEKDIFPLLRELGISLVAYSPLGRGFLTGRFRRFEDLAPDDYRRMQPRFQGENFKKNLELVDTVATLAKAKGATSAQLALAWVVSHGPEVVPIPGTSRRTHLEENLKALELKLDAEDLAAIEKAMPPEAVAGTRYPETMLKMLNQ